MYSGRSCDCGPQVEIVDVVVVLMIVLSQERERSGKNIYLARGQSSSGYQEMSQCLVFTLLFMDASDCWLIPTHAPTQPD